MKSKITRSLYSPAMLYFLEVAEVGSIRGAGRKLNIASSAVNRHILQLEEVFQLSLFERTGRRMRLSRAGEVLLRHVKATLRDFDGVVADVDALKGLQTGVVTISTVESVALALLPEIVLSFTRRHPGIQIYIDVRGSENVTKSIRNEDAHIGFTFNPPETRALASVLSHDFRIGAVVRSDHPLAKQDRVHLKQCLNFPLLLPAKTLSIRKILDAALGDGTDANLRVIEVNSLAIIRSLVRSSNHVGFQTKLGLEEDLASGRLVFKELADAELAQDRFSMIISTGRPLNLAPAAFFEHAKKHLVAGLWGY